ncbi:MAG: ComEC/Rec2 family competence protein, partial [Candidatus Taylorbacteria bacterium]|nr:ComEC/Rec2 family competence protein [Candidatus Taylorbacteria bacterium]
VKANHQKVNWIIIGILLGTILFRSWFAFHNGRDSLIAKYSGKVVDITGIIVDEPLVKDFTKTFIVETDEMNIRVSTERYANYEYGQKILLTGKLSEPFNFKSNGGRTFDYINFLLKDGIYFEMKKPKIEILANDQGSFISKNLFKVKQGFLENIKKVLGEPHAALAGGLVVGEKSALGKELIDDFRKAGLIHIVVLSGYNITIVADSIRRLLVFLPRNLGIILGGLGIIAFGILVGGGATVVRSCIMAIIALVGTLLRKDYNVGKALFVAGSLMLIQNPLILLYDPSFQLSFLATLGLVLLSPIIEKRFGFITEKFGIRGLIASTLATQIFISPYILYMMGQLSIIGIVVNILVLPIIPVTMLFVTLTGLFGFVSVHISEISGWISYLLLSYELFMVKFFANLPFASIELSKFSFWIVVGFYLCYFVALTKFSRTFFQFRFKKKSST